VPAYNSILSVRGEVLHNHSYHNLLRETDIAVMTHGPGGGTPFPPVRALAERCVRLFSGTDGVRDAWGPLNGPDMLERAYLVAYVNGLRDDPGIELTLEMATRLATSSQVRQCVSTQWLRFSLGRSEDTERDSCSLAVINDRFAKSDYDLRELIVAIATSDAMFYLRQPASTEGQ